jgi:hypothetical protein
MAIGSQDLAPGQLRGFDDDRLGEELFHLGQVGKL